jgi:transposase-like protein
MRSDDKIVWGYPHCGSYDVDIIESFYLGCGGRFKCFSCGREWSEG